MQAMADHPATSLLYKYRYVWLFGLLAIITLINLHIDIMDVDAAQYASISLEMARTGEYLQVYHKGNDYLDKPPLLFWLSSASISVFGNTDWAYKLPSVLLLWIGLWALYKLTSLWYDKRTGILAALIYGSTQAFFLMTHDVRTDGLLTAFVLLSLYFISLFLLKGSIKYLLLGGIWIGCAMLAKGPIGLIIPGVAVGGHLLITRQWRKIFDPRWLLLLVPIGLILAPMLYGLYMQFDMHPEKEVYGLKGPSGIAFYFWTQSFGRITGSNYWDNDTSVFYFFQTILWDLQPWIILFIPALIWRFISLFQRKENESKSPEWISFFAFVIPFIALSFSKYKLPHYIFPLLAFAAVMIAEYVSKKADRFPRWFDILFVIGIHLLLGPALAAVLWVFPEMNVLSWAIVLLMYALFWYFRKTATNNVDKWILPAVCMSLVIQFTLSLHFYPHLMKYQSTSLAGKLIGKEVPASVRWLNVHGNALDYYAGRFVKPVVASEIPSLPEGTWIYTDEEGKNSLGDHKVIAAYNDYPVTLLSLSFLNPDRREGKMRKRWLVEIVSGEW